MEAKIDVILKELIRPQSRNLESGYREPTGQSTTQIPNSTLVRNTMLRLVDIGTTAGFPPNVDYYRGSRVLYVTTPLPPTHEVRQLMQAATPDEMTLIFGYGETA
jgi:hypothetical protein